MHVLLVYSVMFVDYFSLALPLALFLLGGVVSSLAFFELVQFPCGVPRAH